MTGSGFAHDIAGGQGNLVIAGLQSPNFATQVSGWQVRKDGSAEFNNVTIRGGVSVGGTSLTYNGIPAFGNLVESVAGSRGTDPFGNAYLGGFTSYFNSGTVAASFANGAVSIYTASGPGGPWTLGSAGIGFGTAITSLFGAIAYSSFGVASPTAAGQMNWVPPSGDTTGAADRSAILAALSSTQSASLTPGAYYLSAPIVFSNSSIIGAGDTTIIQPGSSWSGAALLEPGSGALIANANGYGGSNTRGSNPAANFIQPGASAQFWACLNVRCSYMNGWVIYGNPAQGSHLLADGIRGEHNGGGIACDNGTSPNITAEWSVSNADLQNCETNPIIYLSNVTDFLYGGAPVNGSILGGAAASAISINGTCQTCIINGLDVGGSSAAPGLVLNANSSGNPSEIEIGPGTVQNAQVGVQVNAGTRLYFHGTWAKASQTDGWQWNNGTGILCVMDGCGGNGNNKSAGTGYDVNVTNANLHLCNDKFRYASTGVTAGRFLVASNHYTESNPPASLTSAGAAPGGW